MFTFFMCDIRFKTGALDLGSEQVFYHRATHSSGPEAMYLGVQEVRHEVVLSIYAHNSGCTLLGRSFWKGFSL